jgi:hypothetical protein
VLHFLFFHTILPADFLRPSQAPLLKTLCVFLICFPKCSSFSTIQSCAPNVASSSKLSLIGKKIEPSACWLPLLSLQFWVWFHVYPYGLNQFRYYTQKYSSDNFFRHCLKLILDIFWRRCNEIFQKMLLLVSTLSLRPYVSSQERVGGGAYILTEFLLQSFTTVCPHLYTQVTWRRARFSARILSVTNWIFFGRGNMPIRNWREMNETQFLSEAHCWEATLRSCPDVTVRIFLTFKTIPFFRVLGKIFWEEFKYATAGIVNKFLI